MAQAETDTSKGPNERLDEARVAIPVKFTVTATGYESQVTVDGADPQRAGELVTEWLEFQMRYLSTIKPGDTVTARR